MLGIPRVGDSQLSRSVLTACLALTEELKGGTIEKVLGKSDIEVAVDFLSGKLKP